MGVKDTVKDDPLFKLMEREESLASRVASEIERQIVDKQLAASDRLPSERDLGEQFGVSRTVVREAVRTLVAKGMLEVKTGSGTVVRGATSASAAEAMLRLISMRQDSSDPERVIEVRMMLEVEIAGLAALRRTDEDLRSLADILAYMEHRLDDPETFIESDVAFHEALARATHNDLFQIILSSIVQVMVDVRLLGLQVPGTPARALAFHRQILRSVEAGDGPAARKAMTQHMQEARTTIRAALAQLGRPPTDIPDSSDQAALNGASTGHAASRSSTMRRREK